MIHIDFCVAQKLLHRKITLLYLGHTHEHRHPTRAPVSDRADTIPSAHGALPDRPLAARVTAITTGVKACCDHRLVAAARASIPRRVAAYRPAGDIARQSLALPPDQIAGALDKETMR